MKPFTPSPQLTMFDDISHEKVFSLISDIWEKYLTIDIIEGKDGFMPESLFLILFYFFNRHEKSLSIAGEKVTEPVRCFLF